MDVRFSPEQQAFCESVAQVVERLGPKSVGQLGESERSAKLDAAVEAAGWRELRASSGTGDPWASGVETAIVAEELARGVGDAPFLGPTLAAELRRLAGVAPATTRETVAVTPDLGALGGAIAVDAGGAVGALAVRDGTLLEVAIGGLLPPVDLTRPSAAVGEAGTEIGTLSGDDVVRWSALGLALTSADLVGAMPARSSCLPPTRGTGPSTGCRSGRSRPCSTCSPTPLWRRRGPAASPCTRRGR